MTRNRTSRSIILVLFFWFITPCDDDLPVTSPQPIAPPSLYKPIVSIARAGNDTTLFLPFSTYNLNGTGSKDKNGPIVSYDWRQINGPSSVDISNSGNGRAFVSFMLYEGIYEFELTVTDTDKLTAKDTLEITVVRPTCTGPSKEILLENQVWVRSWLAEIQISHPHRFLPPNSHIRNFYIKRDFSDKWELIAQLNYNSPLYGLVPEWSYGNNILVIYPGSNQEEDTPDIKIEYCQ